MTRREEQIQWLQALVSSYLEEHDWDADEDPSATWECVKEVRGLIRELQAELRTLEQMSVAFDDHQQLPEFDVGGESGGA